MKSPFDLNQQNTKIESKIVVALERISEAFRVLLWSESKENSLSPIQIQILIFLLFHSEEKCKVSYLAEEFNMTKATISDSIRVLLKKELVQKFNNPSDTRSYIIGLTSQGKQIAEKSANFTLNIEQPLSSLPEDQKKDILAGLLKVIYQLNKAGVITIQRMCFTCSYYQNENNEHFCKLLQSKLASKELRIDCPEHEFKS
ncbi:MarR family transcriptional regulator [Tenacibaculum discolor]|uniref:MarR family transcriptional regulator n=1 Tax=Tenacibaculum discolor TaxID=361581 RepID=A0A2G1BUK8_9FLAO|nr:MarR family winged helix-turn-helix transcriptional regulator [Tenacibaculum discolor]MDP2541929.1 MarR family winged helix-turn-helix transcriptional regulator [Tenacibaculum discolor]PHN97654.1 MarR family transcriptional regulator [Tenacibaculum discolor]PHO00014.1 MarR family transcriptional regulator [Rhodobacteraceae bacterium 4F10]